MGNPIFKFSLSHAILGSREISEPDGWRDAELKLERHPEFHSLVEYFDGKFIFYGENNVDNGGADFIKQVENTYGYNAELQILIQADFDGDGTYETQLFNGQLDLTELKEVTDNKIQAPIIRNDLWAKFIARLETPVDLSSTTDLDGNAVDPVDPVTIELSSQAIRYSGEYRWDESFTYEDTGTDKYYQLDWDKTIIDDLKKFTISRSVVSTPVAESGAAMTGQFVAPWDGEFTFNVRIMSADLVTGSYSKWASDSSAIDFYIGRAGLPTTAHQRFTASTLGPYTFTPPGGFPDDTETILVSTYQGSYTLKKGDQIVIYGDDSGGSGLDRTIFGEARWTYRGTCLVATTANITLSGAQTIDGVGVVALNRVLVKDQGNPAENGLYVAAVGAWTRASDANIAAELNSAAVYVSSGTVNGDSAWKQTEQISALGTDHIVWKFLQRSDEYLWRYPTLAPAVSNYITVAADTTFQDTQAEGYLIHDAFAGVIQRICGRNAFYSEVFGRTDTNVRQYASNGCFSKNMLLKGLQIRGYPISEKHFFVSFKDLWEGADPIFCLGLGYEDVNGVEMIRLEDRATFYETTTSTNFENVKQISREYDTSVIYNRLEFGYKKWQSEDLSGLDDPQTKRVWATIISKVKNALQCFSDFIAASTAIEVTRRKMVEEKADYKYDNDIFIIAINTDVATPDYYFPELDENYDTITGLLNSDTRYNSIHTPLRMLLRWAKWWNGSLQKYQTSLLRFVSGEGNYDMISDYSCTNGDVCMGILCDPLSEKQNINLATYGRNFGYFHLPLLYTVETINASHEDYFYIRNNRRKAIGISQSDTNIKRFFIRELVYKVANSQARIMAWPYDDAPIVIVETDGPLGDGFEADPDPEPDVENILLESNDDLLLENSDLLLLE